MAAPRPKILVIDDDAAVASALHRGLAPQYQADLAFKGATGLRKARQGDYAAILLDMHLPDMPGLVLCQKFRDHNTKTPLIIITADPDLKRKVAALNAGADDYIIKPVNVAEIKARLKAILRRNNSGSVSPLTCADLVLDSNRREVIRDGQLISLRRKEFDLLECLLRQVGTVVSRETLINYAWNGDDSVWTNSVDVQIKYLRDKIDRPYANQLIKTVRGLGYKLSAD